ncbi:hypothetical protein [Ralstonia wenshanensis]|uniref:hypothetical protein n=1 Tax=Ralstonia wenshanensis TaxID=2842456 RepID=UPI003D9632DC
MSKKSFLAKVQFSAHHDLSALAIRLSATTGVAMPYDESGRYDEVPAFIGEHGELELTLFGPPEEHRTDECVLVLRMHTEHTLEALRGTLPKFFWTVLINKEPNERGYIDCSGELALALHAGGFVDCSPVT